MIRLRPAALVRAWAARRTASQAPHRRAAASAASGAAQPPPPPPALLAPPLTYATLPPRARAQVDAYLDVLLEWNATRMNLTAVRGRDEALERHVDDCLALLPALDWCLEQQALASAGAGEEGGGRRWEFVGAGGGGGGEAAAAPPPPPPGGRAPLVVDVGSGAGLPGLVLAIARPGWRVCLLDSLHKRCAFVEAAAAAAAVPNAAPRCARAEDAARDPALRGRADAAVARAVAEMRVLAELALPLVAVGGHLVAAKGPDPGAEVAAAANALGQCGGRLLHVAPVRSGSRTAVVVRKARPTPAALPRRAGVPKKAPL